MINIDSLTLKLFVQENAEYFEDARIQKIQQPTRRDLIIQLHGGGETRKLYININPSVYHVCFISPESAAKRHITVPQQPPMFCMLLRKYMVGSRIVRVNVPEDERILEIYFETYSEIGEIIPLCLAVELMGKHSNVILYNYDTNIILGCMHNIGAEKSREREMAGGLNYVYPPKSKRENFLNTPDVFVDARLQIDKDNISESFSHYFQYVSRALMNEIVASGNIKGNLKKALLHNDINPSVAVDYKDFSLFSFVGDGRIYKDSVNSMIDDYFSFYMEKSVVTALKQSLLTIASKELKKNKTTFDKQENQAGRLDKALVQKRKADIIMANLYQLKQGVAKVKLNDFETGELVEIDMDEALSPVENANRYYKLYSKAKTAFEVATEMMVQTKEKISYYENLVFQIESAQKYEDLADIEEELIPKYTKQKKSVLPAVEEVSVNGFRVFIGKNNKQNDYIFSKISMPEDVWFHAYNSPGSHVLVKLDEKKEIDDDTLVKVARIAKKYSKQSASLKASIIYTKRKYLKRPPNTPAGYVTYKNEQEIVVAD
ncbi:NFACT family protein [bacterium]|nr:NFACT family protein [bacterium]